MKLKRVDTINVIPFIDIMLVLLVIVLTTATFLKKEVIPINLPQASHAKKSTQTKPTRIAIQKNGSIYLDDQSVSIEALQTALSHIDSTHPIELYSDRKTAFESFVKVMELLTLLKHKELFIITQK